MSTVAIKNTMVMNNTEKKASLVERFKKYVLDNAEYFAVASAVMSGNGYAAGQIMRDARRVAKGAEHLSRYHFKTCNKYRYQIS